MGDFNTQYMAKLSSNALDHGQFDWLQWECMKKQEQSCGRRRSVDVTTLLKMKTALCRLDEGPVYLRKSVLTFHSPFPLFADSNLSLHIFGWCFGRRVAGMCLISSRNRTVSIALPCQRLRFATMQAGTSCEVAFFGSAFRQLYFGQRRKFQLKNLKVQSSDVELVFTQRGSAMHLYAVAALLKDFQNC